MLSVPELYVHSGLIYAGSVILRVLTVAAVACRCLYLSILLLPIVDIFTIKWEVLSQSLVYRAIL